MWSLSKLDGETQSHLNWGSQNRREKLPKHLSPLNISLDYLGSCPWANPRNSKSAAWPKRENIVGTNSPTNNTILISFKKTNSIHIRYDPIIYDRSIFIFVFFKESEKAPSLRLLSLWLLPASPSVVRCPTPHTSSSDPNRLLQVGETPRFRFRLFSCSILFYGPNGTVFLVVFSFALFWWLVLIATRKCRTASYAFCLFTDWTTVFAPLNGDASLCQLKTGKFPDQQGHCWVYGHQQPLITSLTHYVESGSCRGQNIFISCTSNDIQTILRLKVWIMSTFCIIINSLTSETWIRNTNPNNSNSRPPPSMVHNDKKNPLTTKAFAKGHGSKPLPCPSVKLSLNLENSLM